MKKGKNNDCIAQIAFNPPRVRTTAVYPPNKIQSTPPHRERPSRSLSKSCHNKFQSTPPHRERRDVGFQVCFREFVSIHAPA